MGLFGIIESALDAALTAAAAVCAKIGGAVMNGVSKFIVAFPGLGVAIEAVRVIITIIAKVADIMIDKPAVETPEELGVKAERCQQEEGLTPEDFESVEAYIEHLRNDIKVDQAQMEAMSVEERQAYAAVGAGLYVQAMEGRYGIRMEPEFWRAIYAANIQPEAVPDLVQGMKTAGVGSGKVLDTYLAGGFAAGGAEQQGMLTALTHYAQARGADLGSVLLDLNQNYRLNA